MRLLSTLTAALHPAVAIACCDGPSELFGDNEAANSWAKHGSMSKVGKLNQHIKRDYHLVREQVSDGKIAIYKVGSPSCIPDCYTKGNSKEVCERLHGPMRGYEKWAPNFNGSSTTDRTPNWEWPKQLK